MRAIQTGSSLSLHDFRKWRHSLTQLTNQSQFWASNVRVVSLIAVATLVEVVGRETSISVARPAHRAEGRRSCPFPDRGPGR
jgi:hypothetical protein